jgi:hypothetical protein
MCRKQKPASATALWPHNFLRHCGVRAACRGIPKIAEERPSMKAAAATSVTASTAPVATFAEGLSEPARGALPPARCSAGAPPLRTQWPGLRAGGPPPAPLPHACKVPASGKRVPAAEGRPYQRGPRAEGTRCPLAGNEQAPAAAVAAPGRNQRPKHSRWDAAPPGGRRAVPCGGELSAQAGSAHDPAAAAMARRRRPERSAGQATQAQAAAPPGAGVAAPARRGLADSGAARGDRWRSLPVSPPPQHMGGGGALALWRRFQSDDPPYKDQQQWRQRRLWRDASRLCNSAIVAST